LGNLKSEYMLEYGSFTDWYSTIGNSKLKKPGPFKLDTSHGSTDMTINEGSLCKIYFNEYLFFGICSVFSV
jgi:hypothetical protein